MRNRAFGFRGTNSTSGCAVQANPTSENIFPKENNNSTLSKLFGLWLSRSQENEKRQFLVFIDFVARFLPGFVRRFLYLLYGKNHFGVQSEPSALFLRE